MLMPGTAAPAFELPDESGNRIRLAALLGDGPLILYFYPADFTPGCTKEACSIRDLQAELAAAGLQVAGVSPQDAESHQRFREKYGLPYRLLSDVDKTVIRAYDADGPLGIGVRRISYLIGAGGNIEDAVQADLRIARHVEFVERAIAAQKG